MTEDSIKDCEPKMFPARLVISLQSRLEEYGKSKIGKFIRKPAQNSVGRLWSRFHQMSGLAGKPDQHAIGKFTA